MVIIVLFEYFTWILGLIVDFGCGLFKVKILGFVHFLNQFSLKLVELSPSLIVLAHVDV